MTNEDEEIHEEVRTLGLERWVQFAFVLMGGLAFFIGDKLITFLYDLAASVGGQNEWFTLPAPSATLITGVAAIIGILTGFLLYRHPRAKPMADEVAGELSKVTWPNRPETMRNTIVVIVTSILAAIYLFLFDSVWSAFTDLIYGS